MKERPGIIGSGPFLLMNLMTENLETAESVLDRYGSHRFPTTRYQGSKVKLLEWIWGSLKDLQFETVLDAFGGTGSVAYMFKTRGKSVTYNDYLKFNFITGKALIENDSVILTDKDLNYLLDTTECSKEFNFVQENFSDVYFTDEENQWIDGMIFRIEQLGDDYKKALACFALFQSCIIKRPFNLFHRKNLYLRFSDVKRSFGNKTTWDRSFDEYFRKFAYEANSAVFSNKKKNKAYCGDVMSLDTHFDLVYIDTPYISSNGTSVNYHEFYHFLEGLV